MANFIQREMTIVVNGNTASLNEPIYLYPRDRYIDIYFTIKDAGYQFSVSGSYGDNAKYARIKYIRKDKTSEGVISPSKLEVDENGRVKLSINDDFMCKEVNGKHIEITPGVYLLQILLYDEDKGRITIPPVEFEILKPIFEDPFDENGEHKDNSGDIFSIEEDE